MAVRGLGCPVRFSLTGGHRGDASQAMALMDGLAADVVMADAAFDSDEVRDAIAKKGAVAVIPNNPSRTRRHKLDKHLYAQRHLVECCFSRLKQFQRVATRYEKPCETTTPLSPSPLWSYGSDKCPYNLERLRRPRRHQAADLVNDTGQHHAVAHQSPTAALIGDLVDSTRHRRIGRADNPDVSFSERLAVGGGTCEKSISPAASLSSASYTVQTSRSEATR